jgi:uncharacterized membrane protein YpjA
MGTYWKWFIHWLGQPPALKLLIVINFAGTIYGYLWYGNQLQATPWYWWPFVADSPTASLFFTIFLCAFLFGKRWPFVEAFAAVTLVKYGVWATVMIVWTGLLGGELNWQHYMLIASHLGMAIQAFLYISYYSFDKLHLFLVAGWTLTNDVLDYTVGIFPWLNSVLHPLVIPYIFGFTILLSVSCITIFHIGVCSKRHCPTK